MSEEEKIHPFVEKMKSRIKKYFTSPDLFTADEIDDLDVNGELGYIMNKYVGFISYQDESINEFYWLFVKNNEDLNKKLENIKNNKDLKIIAIERTR